MRVASILALVARLATSAEYFRDADAQGLRAENIEERLVAAATRHRRGLDMDCAYPNRHRWWQSLRVETLSIAAQRNPSALQSAVRNCIGVDIPVTPAAEATEKAVEVLLKYLVRQLDSFAHTCS